MASKDPIARLDELISKASERVSALKSENFRLSGKVRELEAEVGRLGEEVEGKRGEGKRVGELEEKISRLETERDEVRKRVEAAAGRLRKMLSAAGTPVEEGESAEPEGEGRDEAGTLEQEAEEA